ncbi:MAG TPA: hypothetical protein VHU87_09430 [Rhizomicrobium sp.]|jgi:predicted aspartyl protease|nr:hypothetical protein [Rhizomicrobium sp.]
MSITTRPAALLFAAAALFANSAEAQDCKLTEMSSLPMGFTSGGHLSVPVTINGTAQNMIVEPGSPIGEVTQKLVDTLGLKVHSLSEATSRNPVMRYGPFYLGNGEHAKYMTQIESLTIGMERASYTEFIVNPYLSDDNGALAGALGFDIWNHFDLDFDFGAGKLNLFSPEHCAGKVVYWSPAAYVELSMSQTPTGAIGATMTLDGHDVDATLDVGSDTTIMTLPEARAAYGIDEHSPGVEALTENGQTIYRTHFKTLTLSGIAVTNPEIYLVPDKVGEQARKDVQDQKLNGYQGNEGIAMPHLTVGLNVLRRLHLYVAYEEHKIYATAADAHDGASPH